MHPVTYSNIQHKQLTRTIKCDTFLDSESEASSEYGKNVILVYKIKVDDDFTKT